MSIVRPVSWNLWAEKKALRYILKVSYVSELETKIICTVNFLATVYDFCCFAACFKLRAMIGFNLFFGLHPEAQTQGLFFKSGDECIYFGK